MTASASSQPAPLRVCYFGAYRAEYSRNRIMIEGLRRNGVDVVECHEQLWHSIEDRVQTVRGGWANPRFWLRVAGCYLRLLRKFGRLGNRFDVMVVGYPGQFDVFLARLLCLWAGKPLVWDVFMSIYLIAWERNLHQQNAPIVRLIRAVEKLATRLPNRLIMDTAHYVAWFRATHGVDPRRCGLVPTGADSTVFQPVAQEAAPTENEVPDKAPLRVVYHGSFIPNHGIRTVIEAAALLKDDPTIRFELIGDGPERALAEDLAHKRGLTNVTFVDWLAQPDLVQRVGTADLCLGVFGSTPQSLMTVQNKIYECLALRRPVLSGAGPAVQAALRNGSEIFLCERNNPTALASAIAFLCAAPEIRERLAEAGHRRFLADYDLPQIGARFVENLRGKQSK